MVRLWAAGSMLAATMPGRRGLAAARRSRCGLDTSRWASCSAKGP